MAAKLAPERREDLAQSDVSNFHSSILARLKIVELVAGLADSECL